MPRPSRRKAEPRPAPPAAPTPSPRLAALKLALAVGGALAFLVLLAWHRYPIVAAEPGGRFEDPDAAYHARRAMRAVSERTFLPPVFDPAQNWPEGGRAVWPPLHDATLALLARLGGSTPADPGRGMLLAAALPVLETVLVLLAVAALARRFAGDRAGIVAAWLLALTPWMAVRGGFGDIDHNVTEALCAVALFAVAHLVPRGKGAPGALLAAAAWGGAVLLAMGFYTGLLLSTAVVASGAWVVDLLDRGEGPRRSAPLALGFALAALALPFFAALRVRPDPLDPWRLGPVHSLALGLAAAGLAAGGALLAFRDRKLGAEERVLLAGGGALGVVAAFLARGAASAFGKAFGFLGARDAWLGTIDEFQPLATRSGAVSKAMPAFLVAAVALAAALPLLKAKRETRRALLPAAVPCVLFGVLTFLQMRFVLPAVAFAALAGGVAWGLVRERLAARVAAWSALGLGVLWASWMLFGMLGAALHPGDAPLDETWAGERAGRLLAEAARGRADSASGGVLAPWSDGHHLQRYSGLPVVLTPFGSMYPGFEPKMRLFLESSPARFAAQLGRLRVRWLVLPGPAASIQAARALGDPMDRWGTPRQPSEAAMRTVASRLFLMGPTPIAGDSPEDRAALARFQVVAAPERRTDAMGHPLPPLAVFRLE